MTIEDVNTVDFSGIDRSSSEFILAISDHLPWNDDRRYDLLEQKITSYLSYLSSGQFLETHPEASGMKVRIDLICQYEPPAEHLEILDAVKGQLGEMGINFSQVVLPPA